MSKTLGSLSILICAFIAGCAQSRKGGEEGHSSENNFCLQNFIEPTTLKNILENPDIGNFSPLIIFGAAKSEIHPAAVPALDSIAKFLEMSNHGYLVVVHSDKNGPKSRVFALSEDRAESIVKYLIGKGIGEGRLKPIGAGWKCFIGNEYNEEDQRKNRRVEFVRM